MLRNLCLKWSNPGPIGSLRDSSLKKDLEETGFESLGNFKYNPQVQRLIPYNEIQQPFYSNLNSPDNSSLDHFENSDSDEREDQKLRYPCDWW
jgi:hypothetical protein